MKMPPTLRTLITLVLILKIVALHSQGNLYSIQASSISNHSLQFRKVVLTTKNKLSNELFNREIDSLNTIYINSWNTEDSPDARDAEVWDTLLFVSPTLISGWVNYDFKPEGGNGCCWQSKYFTYQVKNGNIKSLKARNLFKVDLKKLYIAIEGGKITYSNSDTLADINSSSYCCVSLSLFNWPEKPDGYIYWDFVLTPQGLLIAFDTWRNTENDAGLANSTIPWKQLKPYLKPEFYTLLAKYKGNTKPFYPVK